MPSPFGSRVRETREALGWTLPDLNAATHKLGVAFAEGEIGRIERGQVKNPALHKVAALARALGVTTDYLITGDAAAGGEAAPGGTPDGPRRPPSEDLGDAAADALRDAETQPKRGRARGPKDRQD